MSENTRMSNPYIYRGPIQNRGAFIGRDHECAEIATFLRGNQSISIVGPRKIGKTSLLFHLLDTTVQRSLDLGPEFLWVYMDCEVLAEGSHQEIYDQMVSEIQIAMVDRGIDWENEVDPTTEDRGRIGFERVLRFINRLGYRVVMMLDEFERLSVNPSLNVNFFNALRSAASRYQLAFVTASARPLIQLTFSGKSSEILSSPFFNIFAVLFLGLFPEGEARQAICTPAELAGRPFSAPTVDEIYDLVGGHPLGIQIASFHNFDPSVNGAAREERITLEITPHYEYYWQSLNNSEQRTLTRIREAVEEATNNTTLRGILRDLVQKCLLIQVGHDYRFPSQSWENFVAGRASEEKKLPWSQKHSLEGYQLGSYEILEPIARGGMAEVYRGRHTRLDRTVAIKVLPGDVSTDADFRKRFENEAQAISNLRHPNIVQVFDFGEISGIYFMVMEYIGGQSLAAHLKEKGRLPLPEVISLVADLADALDYAHLHNVIHRDVKPSNILLRPVTGPGTMAVRAILTDFGIAKIRGGSSSTTRTGILMGTLEYIAPEQIRSSAAVDRRADIYSIAVLTYRMLTGRLPFAGDNPGAVMMSHLSDAPPDAREMVPDLPEITALAIMRAMSKDPAARPLQAGDFLRSLQP